MSLLKPSVLSPIDAFLRDVHNKKSIRELYDQHSSFIHHIVQRHTGFMATGGKSKRSRDARERSKKRSARERSARERSALEIKRLQEKSKETEEKLKQLQIQVKRARKAKREREARRAEEEEAKRAEEEEAKRAEEEAKRAEEEAKHAEEEAEHAEEEAERAREEEAKRAENASRRAKIEAERAKIEAKRAKEPTVETDIETQLVALDNELSDVNTMINSIPARDNRPVQFVVLMVVAAIVLALAMKSNHLTEDDQVDIHNITSIPLTTFNRTTDTLVHLDPFRLALEKLKQGQVMDNMSEEQLQTVREKLAEIGKKMVDYGWWLISSNPPDFPLNLQGYA